MIKLVPFEVHHIKFMRDVRNDITAFGMLLNDDYLQRLKQSGPSFSAFIDRSSDYSWTLLGSAGVGVYWQGVGEGWLIACSLVDQHKLSFHRTVKRKLHEIQESQELHRVQTVVETGNRRACRWAEALGFDFEGELTAYGPNRETYLRYARVIL